MIEKDKFSALIEIEKLVQKTWPDRWELYGGVWSEKDPLKPARASMNITGMRHLLRMRRVIK